MAGYMGGWFLDAVAKRFAKATANAAIPWNGLERRGKSDAPKQRKTDMAHSDAIRASLRAAYVFDRLPMEQAAARIGVSPGTAARLSVLPRLPWGGRTLIFLFLGG